MALGNNKGKTDNYEENRNRLAGLYEEYFDRIARYVYARIGDQAEAQDIASEVFLRALESLKRYQERGVPMQAWLFKIAHNMVVDHLRKVSGIEKVSIEKIELKSDSDPVQAAEMNLEVERVTIAMQKLTEEQREVVRLRFFGGLSSKEVASVMNKTDGSVREMQSAALSRLRQLMNIGCEQESEQ